jgi:hypothetical protein
MTYAAQRRDVVVPVELDATHVDHALRRTAALVAKFGRLLEVWPDLFEAARWLRTEGRRA